MARIILDSDDEEQSPPPREATTLAAKEPEALTDKANDSLSAHTERQTNSTSSTELLKQEIQKAHDALVEPTPNNKRTMDVNSKISSASPSVRPPKRRKTAIVAESRLDDDDTIKPRRTTSVNPVTSISRQSSSGHAPSNGAAFTSTSTRDGGSVRQATVAQRQEDFVDEWEVPKSSGPDQDSHISTKVKSRNTIRQTVAHGVEAPTREPDAMAGGAERKVGTSSSQITTTLEKDARVTNGQPVRDVLSSPSRKRIRRRATIHQTVASNAQECARSSISPTATRLEQVAARDAIAEDGYARSKAPALSSPTHQRASNISVRIVHRTSQDFIASGLQADFVAHQPISMFPDDSSTVPDNTLSQQRLLQVALAESETSVVEQTKTSARLHDTDSCSIPSSAFVNTPLRPTNSSTGSTSGHTGPATATEQMETLVPQVRVEPAPGSGLISPAGKAQNLLEVAAVRQEVRTEKTSIEADRELERAPLGVVTSQQPDTSTQANATQAPKSKKRKAQPTKAEELNSDELAVGLPKEQYKPRPTRSRSGYAALDQPPASSARPEKATRPKRRKTDSAAMQITKDAELEKVEMITLMGFRPSQAARALEKSNGEVELAIEQLLSKVDPEPGPQQSEISREAVNTNEEKAVDAIPDQTDAKPPNLEANGAASTQLASKPKRKVSSRAVKEQNHNEENPTTLATQAEPPGQGKRGRGRPRKATLPQDQQATNAWADEGDAKDSGATGTIQKNRTRDEKKPDQTILKALEPNSVPTQATNKAPQPPLTATPPDDPVKIPENAKKEADATPLCTPQKAGPATAKDKTKGPTSHSPIDKAKVPLRVGLSKRARIAPLLRVVKK